MTDADHDITIAEEPAVQDAAELATTPHILGRPMSLKDGMALLPVEQQEIVLAEYDSRREYFLKWLLGHFKEGVHYGFPPGCGMKLDDEGNILQWNKKQNKYQTIPRSQWRAKPSLYKAGALLVIDLFQLQAKFQADIDAHAMMGSPAGTFVQKCDLFDRSTGTHLGEGRGVFAINEKGMQANAAIKMSEKRAMVDACINSIPVLGDLFTQDRENAGAKDKPTPRASDHPPIDPYQIKTADAPAADPGGPDQAVIARAQALRNKVHARWPQTKFDQWCIDATGGTFDPSNIENWTADIVSQLEKEFARQCEMEPGQ